MSIDDNGVLGIALGSSEAAGYVNMEGNITSWLNELAFAPVDYNPEAPVDEWSGGLCDDMISLLFRCLEDDPRSRKYDAVQMIQAITLERDPRHPGWRPPAL